MKNRNYFNQSAIIKMLVLVLVLLCDVPNAFAEKILKTEINGVKWYLNKIDDYKYDVCTIDGKVIYHDVDDDEVLYSCCSKDDPGRFIIRYCPYPSPSKYLLYDSNGNFIAKLDVSCIVSLTSKYSVQRFKDGNSYYFIIRDFISESVGSRYCLIDDNGRTLLTSPDELSHEVYKLEGSLSGCLLVKNYPYYGLIKLTGETIIPKEKENSFSGEGEFLVARLSDGKNYSLLDREGNFLISNASYIRKSSDGFTVEFHDGKQGVYSTDDRKWLISPEWGYSSYKKFQGPQKATYFRVREANGSLYGVISADGKEVLPCEFEEIEYIGGNFLKFKSGDSWGVITLNSKVIIPTSRGYSSIGKYSSFQKTIPFKKPGYKGECNYLGRQISLVKDTQRTQSYTASATPAKSSTSKSSSAKNNSSSNAQSAQEQKRSPRIVNKVRWIPCINCDPDRKGFCYNCHGQGKEYYISGYIPCSICNGSRVCNVCKGRGEIQEFYTETEY